MLQSKLTKHTETKTQVQKVYKYLLYVNKK